MRRSFKGGISLGCFAVALGLAGPQPVEACSICRCGEPAFAALGLDLFDPGRFNRALDWDRFEKEQGPEDDEERLVEDRYSLTASYAVSDRLTLLARIPWSSRELTEPGHEELKHGEQEHVSASGLSDPELHVNFRLWSAPITSAVGSRGWVGVHAGVKTDRGLNEVEHDGERIDEHAQPGTGSTDWIAGAAGVYVLDPRSSLFGSAQYRHTGTNSCGCRYGSITLVNAGFERSFGRVVDGVLEANYRDADMDQVDDSGTHDPDTGGQMLYAAPRILIRVSPALVARASAQIPVAESLNGGQTEHTVWNAGITWTFGPC
jgi:hypothetical protein